MARWREIGFQVTFFSLHLTQLVLGSIVLLGLAERCGLLALQIGVLLVALLWGVLDVLAAGHHARRAWRAARRQPLAPGY